MVTIQTQISFVLHAIQHVQLAQLVRLLHVQLVIVDTIYHKQGLHVTLIVLMELILTTQLMPVCFVTTLAKLAQEVQHLIVYNVKLVT